MPSPTIACPLSQPQLLPDGTVQATNNVTGGVCPLAGESLTPVEVTIGRDMDTQLPVTDVRGMCPAPCEAVWWLEQGQVCYAGPRINIDWGR